MLRLARQELPVMIVFNKTDLGKKHEPDYRERWQKVVTETESKIEPEWLEVSASTGEGVSALVSALFARLPAGPALFPADIVSDFPRKLNIGEVVREKLFLVLRDELPHAIAVWVEDLAESDAGWVAKVVIYVNKYSQKGIVIGEKGRMLRRVRRAAEAELKVLFEIPVTLDMWVKVEKDWSKNFWLLKKFGYVG
jgi:GTP-binding protein Era